MSAKENPGHHSGALDETAGDAVSGVNSTSVDFDFPLTPAAEAAVCAARQEEIVAADARAARERVADAARAGVTDPRMSGDTPVALSMDAIIRAACDGYLRDEQRPMLRRLRPDTAADGLLHYANGLIAAQNERLKKNELVGTKLPNLTRLTHYMAARLVAGMRDWALLRPTTTDADPDTWPLAVYDGDPSSGRYGTYVVSASAHHRLIRAYVPSATTRECDEVIAAMRALVPERTRGDNRDLIACRNGIVDYNGGDPVLHEFSPEHVFLAKLAVDWNPDAENPHIQTPDGDQWDVESWMSSLSDDPEIVNLLWEITGAVVRPYVSWNKTAFYLSQQGNNGKGTLLALQRNLLGVGNYANIPLSDFGKDFMLEPLTRASAILVDENDVGTFVEKAANFKAIVTNDVITINRKHKAPIAHQHFGFMAQCVNEPPIFKDKSESFYRRPLFIPFTKSFTGVERKYIKDDYLKRRDVLEYVLRRVLTMSYYELSEPVSVASALDEFKEYNDPVRAFWNEMKTQFFWDLVPYQFLTDLFFAWMARNMPNSRPVGRNKFLNELRQLVQAEPDGAWDVGLPRQKHRPGTRMAATEPLIAEYDLLDWANVGARNDPKRFARIPADKLKANYRGLVRREPTEADYAVAAVTEAEVTGGATPPTDPLAVEPMAIPDDGAPGPAGRPAASSDDVVDGGPVPDAPGDDARPPTRTLPPERAAKLAAMGVLSGTGKSEAVTK